MMHLCHVTCSDVYWNVTFYFSWCQDEDDDDYSEMMEDADFLQNVLGSLPGVDPDSEVIQRAVRNLTRDNKKDNNKDEKKQKWKYKMWNHFCHF